MVACLGVTESEMAPCRSFATSTKDSSSELRLEAVSISMVLQLYSIVMRSRKVIRLTLSDLRETCFDKRVRSVLIISVFVDPDVWMREAGDHYEYLVVYVDDLIAVMKKPELFFKALQDDPHNYKTS